MITKIPGRVCVTCSECKKRFYGPSQRIIYKNLELHKKLTHQTLLKLNEKGEIK